MSRPNFFIVGAPKSGTSALAAYLGSHRQVFFCHPKEPCYWADEFPRIREYCNCETLDKYLALFEAANETQVAIGEGSTRYLSSATAVPRILEFEPQARFIVMLRNPVEMVHAMHNTQLYGLNETEEDFEVAWKLQDARLNGESIPQSCLEPAFLQYRNTARFGDQMERFFGAVPENQRHVIIFDDFKSDVGEVYRRTLSFLGLEDDGRTEFPVINASKHARFPTIRRLFRRPPTIVNRPVSALRRYVASVNSGPLAMIKRKFRVEKTRIPLRDEFVAELRDSFRDEVQLLSDLLQRDLMHWVEPPPEQGVNGKEPNASELAAS